MVVILRSSSQSGGGILRTIFSGPHIDGRLHHDVCTEPACVGPACGRGRVYETPGRAARHLYVARGVTCGQLDAVHDGRASTVVRTCCQ